MHSTLAGRAVAELFWPTARRRGRVAVAHDWLCRSTGGSGARLTLLDVRPGRSTGQDEPSVVQVVSLETIQTPTELVRAYRVRLGRETAWYRFIDPTH